jgi:DNA polymerase I
VIELFGRTRDGRSVVVEHSGFHPYFYCLEPPQSLVGALERDPEVVRVEPCTLFHGGKDVPAAKVVLHHPWRTPEYRERCRKYGSEPMAADIPFQLRFIYDMDLGACFRVRGEEIAGKYTTDLVVRAEGFEDCDPFNPPLKILSFDIENTMEDSKLLCLGWVVRDLDGATREGCFSGSEKAILEGFANLVAEEDPDVITGYNIDGYDLPVLVERTKVHGLPPLPLARDHQTLSHIGQRFWRTHGRIVADAWWSVRTELRPKQETLDYVARLLFDEGKEDVDRTIMGEEWARDPEKVMSYCIQDARLALRILEHLAKLDKSMELATVARLPLDDVFNGRTSTLIDSILIRAADREKVAVPMTRPGRGGGRIAGGYVHSLEPGLYEWVVSLDFASMYPSIIMENNICFTTLSDRGTVVSPTGARFLSKEERVGLLPRILERLMKDRAAAKQRMREETDREKRAYYGRLQDALKVLMNAFYGVLASSFYRFTNPDIGASITAFARENIHSIIRDLEADGVRVIYADTDSIFFQSPYANLEETLAFGEKVAERFSHGLIHLELERIFRSMFSHGKKKRYAAKVAWPTKGEFVVRGYEIRRTDAFELQALAQKRVFDRILENDVDEAVKLARDLVANLQAGRIPEDMVPPGTPPMELLVISRSVQDESRYVNPDSMANVRAARKLAALGYEVVPGMKVSWIVTKGSGGRQEVEPYVSGRPFGHEPDWEYYARRLAQTLSYVTEVYGWDERSLVAGSQQVTLFHGNFGERKRPSKGVRKTDKPLTLEDFL